MATVVAFHAHPDDEVILTGGTLARLAAEGHRVVVVAATDGDMGETPQAAPTGPAADRVAELRDSARELGVHRVEHLGYADSGHGPLFYADPPGRTRFARADTGEAAERLADILAEERADVLLSYEANGGYGHRDHVKVHEVGERAAELADTPRMLYATMPREKLVRGSRLAQRLHVPYFYRPEVVPTAYSPQASITHRIDVRGFAGRKKRAMARHRSQMPRFVPRFLSLVPAPVFALFAGQEWLVERGADASVGARNSVFDDAVLDDAGPADA